MNFKLLSKLTALLLVPFLLTSCLGWFFGEEELPPPEHIVTVNINSRSDTNSGRLMYILIRHVSRKAFVSEDYDTVSQKVFADPPDSSVLVQKLIIPGQSIQLTLDDKRKDIAIYCFFSNPGKFWNAFIPFDPEKDEHTIELASRQILTIE